MKLEFKKTIDKLKAEAKEPIPRIRFSADSRSILIDSADRLDYFEAMTILLESHPLLPFTAEYSLGSDTLYFRRALAYEVIVRLLGHCRSLVANVNAFNHIGTGVALRCMLELYAFLIYMKKNKMVIELAPKT